MIAGECQIAQSELLEDEKISKLKQFGKQMNKNNEIVGGLNNIKSHSRNILKDKETRANSKIHDERTDEWAGKRDEEAMTIGSDAQIGKSHGGYGEKKGQDQIRLGGDLTVAEAQEWRTRWREVAAMSKSQP